MKLRRLADTALRLRHLILVGVWAALLTNSYLAQWAGTSRSVDLFDFVYGGRALLGTMPSYHAGALHLFANLPVLQIGPPPLLFVGAISYFSDQVVQIVITAVIFASGLVAVLAVERTAFHLTPHSEHRRVKALALGGGALVLWSWVSFLKYFHFEDAIALACIALAAAVMASGRRSWVAGALIGFAAACKPWAIVAVPILLALPPRQRWRALGAVVVSAGVWWMPFVIADPHTVRALGGQGSYLFSGSVLHALGADLPFAPPWAHTLMLEVAVAFGAIAVYRKRWLGVPLVGFAARVLFEPKTFLYYGTGPMFAALLWDLTRPRRRFPVMTVTTGIAEFIVPTLAPANIAAGFVRLGWVVLVVTTVLVWPARRDEAAAAAPYATGAPAASHGLDPASAV